MVDTFARVLAFLVGITMQSAIAKNQTQVEKFANKDRVVAEPFPKILCLKAMDREGLNTCMVSEQSSIQPKYMFRGP